MNRELNKVQYSVHCKCGTHIMNDEMIKKFDKYYCPKCDSQITSIGDEQLTNRNNGKT